MRDHLNLIETYNAHLYAAIFLRSEPAPGETQLRLNGEGKLYILAETEDHEMAQPPNIAYTTDKESVPDTAPATPGSEPVTTSTRPKPGPTYARWMEIGRRLMVRDAAVLKALSDR